ncbi:MAG: helix-turn-helix transcriptional regulator [Saprospiraceae bacterium]|nr:helix-turn-helix transcriptional regulator [Saprospiraceae bacterium]
MLNIHSFIRDDPYYKKLKVHDLLFVEYKCLVEEVKAGIWSDVNYFVFVTSGKKMWKSIYNEYVVISGDSLFVKKGANLVHQYFDEDYCALMIFIPDDFIVQFLNRFSSVIRNDLQTNHESDAVIRIQLDQYLSGYVNSLASYFDSEIYPDKHLLSLKFEELLLNIFTRPLHRPVAEYLGSLTKDKTKDFKQMLEENFAYNLKLEDLATLCNMSLSTFKRTFNDIYQTSPGKWLSERRLDLAAHLLRNSDKTISQISFESGFEDASSFGRAFKQKYKQTPLQYRNP